jgi:hypothetical protein
VTIPLPVILLIAGLVGLAFAMRSGGRSRPPGGTPWWHENHLPWGAADEPFHPRDRDLRERAWEEAEAEHRRRRAGDRASRMDERYGGDFEVHDPGGR